VSRSAQEIQDWLVARVASLTRLPAAEVDVHAPYEDYGLDSVMVVTLVVDLQNWLGWRLHDNPLDDYPTIAALAQHLARRDAAQPSRTS
jgi:acyl carrier protein